MTSQDWKPSASKEALIKRAELNANIRAFFAERDVLEVETPILNRYPVADANIEPFELTAQFHNGFLHTSPEYAMKRLLCADVGDIYQICKVFRSGEAGGRHNPEFTMLEWYRIGFCLEQLMLEVAELLQLALGSKQITYLTYQQALLQHAGIDVFKASDDDIKNAGQIIAGADLDLSRDGWLDIIMSHQVEPQLATDHLTFIHQYPASQAALATLQDIDQGEAVAQRFEVYYQGIELANGYHELTDAHEQKQRFLKEVAETNRSVDQFLCDALEHGMPQCSGVALGIDRLLMLQMGEKEIAKVLSFNSSIA